MNLPPLTANEPTGLSDRVEVLPILAQRHKAGFASRIEVLPILAQRHKAGFASLRLCAVGFPSSPVLELLHSRLLLPGLRRRQIVQAVKMPQLDPLIVLVAEGAEAGESSSVAVLMAEGAEGAEGSAAVAEVGVKMPQIAAWSINQNMACRLRRIVDRHSLCSAPLLWPILSSSMRSRKSVFRRMRRNSRGRSHCKCTMRPLLLEKQNGW